MDREPLPAPFPKGARLRYIGTRRVGTYDAQGNEMPILAPGSVVTILRTSDGRRGTLRPLPGEWDDEPPIDQTQDGYSAYAVEVPGRKPMGRIIWPADANEWERMP